MEECTSLPLRDDLIVQTMYHMIVWDR